MKRNFSSRRKVYWSFPKQKLCLGTGRGLYYTIQRVVVLGSKGSRSVPQARARQDDQRWGLESCSRAQVQGCRAEETSNEANLAATRHSSGAQCNRCHLQEAPCGDRFFRASTTNLCKYIYMYRGRKEESGMGEGVLSLPAGL